MTVNDIYYSKCLFNITYIFKIKHGSCLIVRCYPVEKIYTMHLTLRLCGFSLFAGFAARFGGISLIRLVFKTPER